MEIEGISSEELFNSALSNESIEALVEPEIEPAGDERQRDEQGRFAPKSEAVPKEPEPEPQAKPETKETESVGMRQLREAFERQSRRTAELQQELQSLRPKPEAPPKPDVFENPEGAIKAGAQELVAPLEQKFSSFIETVSRRDAVREHGQERVTAAFSALDEAAKSGDPQALAVVQAVKQSMDPFGDIVTWHVKNEAAVNPEGFFQRKLDEALKDEKFKGELLAKLQPQQDAPPKPVFNVPPSLNRVAAAAPALSESGDLSNESLFAHATR